MKNLNCVHCNTPMKYLTNESKEYIESMIDDILKYYETNYSKKHALNNEQHNSRKQHSNNSGKSSNPRFNKSRREFGR